jgi:hypothetical protein
MKLTAEQVSLAIGANRLLPDGFDMQGIADALNGAEEAATERAAGARLTELIHTIKDEQSGHPANGAWFAILGHYLTELRAIDAALAGNAEAPPTNEKR